MAEDWRDIKAERPQADEVVLVASIVADGTSIVEFGKFYYHNGEPMFDLYESKGGAMVATHWLRIPNLPPMHNLKFVGHA